MLSQQCHMIWRILFAMSTEAKITSHTQFFPSFWMSVTIEFPIYMWIMYMKLIVFTLRPPNNTIMHTCVDVSAWLKVEKSKQSHRSLEIVDWKGDSIYLLLKSTRIIYDWSIVEQRKNLSFIFFLLLSLTFSLFRSFTPVRKTCYWNSTGWEKDSACISSAKHAIDIQEIERFFHSIFLSSSHIWHNIYIVSFSLCA